MKLREIFQRKQNPLIIAERMVDTCNLRAAQALINAIKHEDKSQEVRDRLWGIHAQAVQNLGQAREFLQTLQKAKSP